MSFLLNIRQFLHTVADKYYVEITATDGAKPIPVGIEHKYVFFDPKTGESDFVDDIKKATCFDFVLGYQVANAIKKVIENKDIQIGLISMGDATFIHEIMDVNTSATKAALTPAEKDELERATTYSKELFELLTRIPGVKSIGPVTEIGQNIRKSAIEINVDGIASKAAAYAFQVGKKNLIERDGGDNSSFKGIPVRIIVNKTSSPIPTP